LGHEIGHFAELFFFHGLTPFSFRVNRERQFPAADKAAPGAGEKREPSLRCILKNRNKPQPVRQENVGFFFRAPRPSPGRFRRGANCPSDPFNRICMTSLAIWAARDRKADMLRFCGSGFQP
jgi:hypothetical protein